LFFILVVGFLLFEGRGFRSLVISPRHLVSPPLKMAFLFFARLAALAASTSIMFRWFVNASGLGFRDLQAANRRALG